MVYPIPGPEILKGFYDGLYAEKAREFNEFQMNLARGSLRGYAQVLKELGVWSPGLTFLDLGGGLGYYSRAAQELGLDVTLIDYDPISVQFACEQHHLAHTHLGDGDTFLQAHPERKFDIVFMRHVIEHAPDPAHFLTTAADLLKPEGILILETDNNRGVEMFLKPSTCSWYVNLYKGNYKNVSLLDLFRKRPLAVNPPGHLFGFRIENLNHLLRSHQFVPMRAFTYCLGDQVYWPNLPDSSIRSVVGAFCRLHLKGFLTELTDWSLIPVRRMMTRLEMASGICIYARKIQQ